MPNPANVMTPINIYGIGRSGTTLLQNILGATGFIQVCNETNDFVCGCWRAGELLNPTHDKQSHGGIDAWSMRTLHAALCVAMPSDKPSWCQKLAGLPKGIRWANLITEADTDYAPEAPFPYAWYWRVMSQAFPQSSDVLILRDYRDVVVSRTLLSEWDPEEIGNDIAIHYNLMAHPANRVGHVIRLEQLVAEPTRQIFSLCDYLVLSMPIAIRMRWSGTQCRRQAVRWKRREPSGFHGAHGMRASLPIKSTPLSRRRFLDCALGSVPMSSESCLLPSSR